MVLVSALVMHPGEAHACIAAFPVVWRLLACVVLGAWDEFCRRVFGKVVEESLEANARLDAKSDDFVAVFCDSDEMTNWVEHDPMIEK